MKPNAGELLDLTKVYPGELKNGHDGERWAEVAITAVAPKAGRYRLARVNDFWGKLTVNGRDCGTADGSYLPDKPLGFGVDLVQGENHIVLKTRAGSAAKWLVGFFLPGDSPLKIK